MRKKRKSQSNLFDKRKKIPLWDKKTGRKIMLNGARMFWFVYNFHVVWPRNSSFWYVICAKEYVILSPEYVILSLGWKFLKKHLHDNCFICNFASYKKEHNIFTDIWIKLQAKWKDYIFHKVKSIRCHPEHNRVAANKVRLIVRIETYRESTKGTSLKV